VLLLLADRPALAQLSPVPPPIDQRHADCARPQYASDILVCSDAELLAIDAEVAALASAPPVLADGAIWEGQAAWLRRRSLCAFKDDHRGCLVAAYTDRRAVLAAAAAPSVAPLACAGHWRGRHLTSSTVAAGQPVTLRENDVLLAVATPSAAAWQSILGWRGAGNSIRLQPQERPAFKCRPAPR
jgi:uncharacterized protein